METNKEYDNIIDKLKNFKLTQKNFYSIMDNDLFFIRVRFNRLHDSADLLTKKEPFKSSGVFEAGSMREVLCTRHLGLIPNAHHPKGTGKNRKPNFDIVAFWDLSLNKSVMNDMNYNGPVTLPAWRSFRIDTVRMVYLDFFNDRNDFGFREYLLNKVPSIKQKRQTRSKLGIRLYPNNWVI